MCIYLTDCGTGNTPNDGDSNNGTDRLTESERIELKSFALNINYNIMNSIVVMY
jgi:hypothetical protein